MQRIPTNPSLVNTHTSIVNIEIKKPRVHNHSFGENMFVSEHLDSCPDRVVLIPYPLIGDTSISADALGVIAFLSSMHQQEQLNVAVDHIKKRFGFGDTVWRRISRELRENGILSISRTSRGNKLVFNLR